MVLLCNGMDSMCLMIKARPGSMRSLIFESSLNPWSPIQSSRYTYGTVEDHLCKWMICTSKWSDWMTKTPTWNLRMVFKEKARSEFRSGFLVVLGFCIKQLPLHLHSSLRQDTYKQDSCRQKHCQHVLRKARICFHTHRAEGMLLAFWNRSDSIRRP